MCCAAYRCRLFNSAGLGLNALILGAVGSGATRGLPPWATTVMIGVGMGATGITVGGGFAVNHLDVLPTAGGQLLGTNSYLSVEMRVPISLR